MPQWLQDLTTGWPMIAANLPTFAAIVALIIGAVWAAFSWGYGRIISHKDAEIKLLERKVSADSRSLPNPDLYSDDPESEALDKQAYNQVVAFCLDHLLPSCDAQVKLQESIVRHSCNDETLAALAVGGLHSDWRYKTSGFWENYTRLLSGLADSPGPTIKFSGIIECIHELEREFYKNFCEQGSGLSASQNINVQRGPSMPEWHRWRDAHLKMVKAYVPIKRDIRFGKLHRLKPDRWGQVWGEIPS